MVSVMVYPIPFLNRLNNMIKNWFPGHMKKSLVALEEKIKLVDIVIEVADARAPVCSRNPLFESLLGNRKHLLVLTKFDLADPDMAENFRLAMETANRQVLFLSKDQSAEIVLEMIDQMMAEKKAGYQSRNIRYTPRALIIGIPNVGKSTLINKLMKKGGVKVENRPGVTRGFTFINLGSLELIDSPGILMMKLDTKEMADKLLAIGCIKDSVADMSGAGEYLFNYLKEKYPNNLIKRYNITDLSIEQIAAKRGINIKNGPIDEQVYQMIVLEYRSGRIGRISLE